MSYFTKLGLLTGAVISLAAAFQASADPVPLPSASQVSFKFQGFTVENVLPTTGSPPPAFGASEGYETTFGAGVVTQITDPNNGAVSYFNSGQVVGGQNQYISFMIYGIADQQVSGSPGSFTLDNVGCTAGAGNGGALSGCDGNIHVDFYLSNTAPGSFTGPGATISPSSRCGFSCLTGITTTGSLLMSWDLAPSPDPTDPTAALVQTGLSSLTLPVTNTGNGSFLANCVAGPECDLFSSASIEDLTTGDFANFLGQFTVQALNIGQQPQNGWEGYINDPVLSETAAAPEPASLALMGAGLAGLGFLRRRRKH